MTMRSYSGLLVFEDIFEFVPEDNPDVVNFARGIFQPNILVTEQDCGTTLGKIQEVNYELEGEVELATGLVISKARLEQLLFQGTYKVATRTLDTCISQDGVCQACYHASRQRLPIPNVGTRVTIEPEYEIDTLVIPGDPSQTVYTLTFDPEEYQFLYVYVQGVLLPETAYSVSGRNLTLTTPITEVQNLVVKFTAYNRSPFLVWLASTFSGSLLGMSPLPAPRLPIRPQLLTSLIQENRLELLINYTDDLDKIPPNFRQYMRQIRDPLERSLYMLALNSIFADVTS